MAPRPRPAVLSCGVFGTLVDRDAGLAQALAAHAGIAHAAQQQAIVEAWHDAAWELADELEEFRPYDELLEEALVRAAARSGALLARTAARAAVATAGEWPLFPDAGPALARFAAERQPLALVSNYPRAAVERVAARLNVTPRRIVTAVDVEAYKPEPDLLLALLHELEMDEDQLLHVAAIPEFDLFTAEDLGVPAAFVDRAGEGLPEDLAVTWRGPGLDALADWLLAAPPRGPRRDGGGPPVGARRAGPGRPGPGKPGPGRPGPGKPGPAQLGPGKPGAGPGRPGPERPGPGTPGPGEPGPRKQS